MCVCVCVLHPKKAEQSPMGQGPIDEIDFPLFLVYGEERVGLLGFSYAVKLGSTMKSNEKRP